jgi:hypothetical protein
METLRIIRDYLIRLLKLWIYWFWFFALDLLGLIINTLFPRFTPPQWLYILIGVTGFMVANIKLYYDREKEIDELINQSENLSRHIHVDALQRQEIKDDLFSKMPKLLSEMKEDLSNSPFVREFFVLSRNWMMNYGSTKRFSYYLEDHEGLENKIQVLENMGLVYDVTDKNVKKYRMAEELVDYLTKESWLL